jgi:hypothetical protein
MHMHTRHTLTASVRWTTAAFEQLNENYPYPIVPTIYLYSFIALFITAILNIFIFIIEDSYHAAKYVRQPAPCRACRACRGIRC